jgi:hypothetical protein
MGTRSKSLLVLFFRKEHSLLNLLALPSLFCGGRQQLAHVLQKRGRFLHLGFHAHGRASNRDDVERRDPAEARR